MAWKPGVSKAGQAEPFSNCTTTENLAILHHLALNILSKEKSKISKRRKIKRAGWSNAFLADILAQI